MIYLGFGLFALVLGFVIGASNSPVVGAFLAIAVGLISSIFGVLKFEAELKDVNKLNVAGSLISVFSVLLIVGVLVGENHRIPFNNDSPKQLPWKDMPQPTSTYEALDWIVLSDKLLALGYSQSDIETLYSIRLDEKKEILAKIAELKEQGFDEHSLPSLYDSGYPFNELIPQAIVTEKHSGRGLASEAP